MRKRIKSLIAILIVLTLQFSIPLSVSARDTNFNDDETYEYIKSMVDMIKTKYSGDFNDDAVLQSLLKSLFTNFDPYTTYYSNEEAASFFTTMNGQVSGIGIQMAQNENKVIVTKVFPNSPAENVGIIVGDIFLSVDDNDVTGLTYDAVSQKVRGEMGTEVKVTVGRNGGVKDFVITRSIVSVPPGSYRIDNGIGYIDLDVFNSNSAEFVSDALAYMDSKSIDKIILDLRDNPGGEVDQAVQIASNFVPKGVIVSLDFKDIDTQDKVYYSDLEKLKYKLAVLVNENSASASEIVTGAIQDSGSGVIIGTKTFGKAKVQNFIPLLNFEAYEKYKVKLGQEVINAYDLINKYKVQPLESEIQGWTKITTGRYLTPKGRMIDLKGLEPDIYIKDNKAGFSFDLNELSAISNDSQSNNIADYEIVNIKKILSIAGYEIDDYSNTMDSNSLNELMRFQKDRGLDATGQLDSSTRNALNNILSLTSMMVNKGYNQAVEELNK